jgi:polyvinyl alcohol dehydrogenase (cytochrome)
MKLGLSAMIFKTVFRRSVLGLVLGSGGLIYAALVAPGCQSSSTATPAADAAPETTTTTASPAPFDCSMGDAGGWSMFGGDVCGTRSGLASDPITAQTVQHLAMKWKFSAAGDVSATPAVVGGQVYVGDWAGMFYRLDAATGQVAWSRSVTDILGLSSDGGTDAATSVDAALVDAGATDGTAAESATLDGSTAADGGVSDGAPEAAVAGPDDAAADTPVASSTDDGGGAAPGLKLSTTPLIRDTPVVAGGLVIAGVAGPAVVVALDQNTGTTVWRTTLDTHPYAGVVSSPIVENGRIYVGVTSGEEGASVVTPGYTCCTFRGSVAALDAATGKLLWQTSTIDDATYRNADGSLSGFSGAAVWSSPALDRNRNLLYVSTGNNYSGSPAVIDGGTPLPDGDHVESIVALDLDTGAVRWSQRMTTGDYWNFGDYAGGPDWDFGSGPNLFQAMVDGGVHDIVGAGQKSGIYWAVDADTHAVLWKRQVGPGGHLGGIHWGNATDGTRVYVGVNNESGTMYKLGGSGEQAGMKTAVGSWAALDPGSGAIVWQVANPAMTAPLNSASVNGPLSVVNGVVFAGSMDADGMMYAFDATSGKVLWSFKSGATVYGGAAIADGVVYWGSGYPASRLGFGTTGKALYAFSVAP